MSLLSRRWSHGSAWGLAPGAALSLLLLLISPLLVMAGSHNQDPNDLHLPAQPVVADGFSQTRWGDIETGLTAVRQTRHPSALHSAPGAAIVVGGRFSLNDPLQANIHHVTNRVYQLFWAQGYPADKITYLATDLSLDANGDGEADVDAMPTRSNLSTAITDWALSRVTADRSLMLYLIDRSDPNLFSLDRTVGESFSPADLDGWLAQLESAVPGLTTYVVIEQCYAGSFIGVSAAASRPGRLILASTSAGGLAYASTTGAVFSDALLDALNPGINLADAFEQARFAAMLLHPDQTPWLDGNGDGIPNEIADTQAAAQHVLFPGAAQIRLYFPRIGR